MFFGQAACFHPSPTTDWNHQVSPPSGGPTIQLPAPAPAMSSSHPVRRLVESTLRGPPLSLCPRSAKAILLSPDPVLIRRRLCSTNRVGLNVGGTRHEVLWKTIDQLPGTRLGRLRKCRSSDDLLTLCDDYDLDSMEFYFDRHPVCFDVVLNYYRTGKLHLVDGVCVMSLAQEFGYWGVDELSIEACCQIGYFRRKEKILDEVRNDEEKDRKSEVEDFGTGCWSTGRQRLWDLMEKPQTSMAARVVATISVLFVVASTVAMTLNTVPSLQGPRDVNNHSTENQYLAYVETSCIGWFTLEYALRLAASPSKWRFLIGALNIIDLLAILPFYVSLILAETNRNHDQLDTVRRIISVFRIMRILRVLKLARHSVGLQSLGHTLQRCHKELGLLVMFLAIGVLFFSSLIYFAEKEANLEYFPSIPESFWWAVITMTTVGYGDVIPKTPLGKVIGSVCCVCGVLVVALPIPIIVNNFSEFYKDQMRRQKMAKQRDALREVQRTGTSGSIVSLHSFTTRNWVVCSLDVINSMTETRIGRQWQPSDNNNTDNKTTVSNINNNNNNNIGSNTDLSSDCQTTDFNATDSESVYDNRWLTTSGQTTDNRFSDTGNPPIRYIDDVSNCESADVIRSCDWLSPEVAGGANGCHVVGDESGSGNEPDRKLKQRPFDRL